MDLLEYDAEPFSAGGVDHFDKRDAAFKVRTEVRVSVTILAYGAEANGVGQSRFEAIEFTSLEIGVVVHHEAGEPLSYSLTHEAGLVVVHLKSLIEQNGGGMKGEALDGSLEGFAAGEREIVGVARVRRTGRLRETGQAAIGAEGA